MLHIEGPDHHMPLWSLLSRYHASAYAANLPLEIVCERFDFKKSEQGRAKIDYTSKEYEGVCKLFYEFNVKHGVRLHLQGSSEAVGKTAFWGDGPGGNAKIKAIGMYVPGMVHGMDALRHYLYYVTFNLENKHFINQLRPTHE